MKKVAFVIIAACLTAMSLVGCGQQNAVEEKQAVEEQPAEKHSSADSPAYDLIIGVVDEEDVDLPVQNGTDRIITGVQFKPIDASEFSANAMAADQTWMPGQTADIYFENVVAEEEAVGPNGGTAQHNAIVDASVSGRPLLLNQIYDVQFMTADGSMLSLHQLSLASLANAEKIIVEYDAESGLSYLSYIIEGNEESTLESERYNADIAIALAQANMEDAVQ